jgi:hypothetical protein
MTTGAGLLSPAEAAAARAGIATARAILDGRASPPPAAASSADERWAEGAYDFVRAYLADHAELTVSDLWAAGLVPPADRGALGAVIGRAVRDGLMADTGRLRPSATGSGRGAPVWRSLLCDDEARP